MSGRESIKGYLYQTWVSILKSLNQDWRSIILEPKTENDKIDIIWTYENSSVEVCQVKSSINNFTKNNILEWIDGLYKDNPRADKFIIILIGNSSSTVKSFFNNISTKKKNEFSKFGGIYSIKEKVQVKFEPENLGTLEAAVIAGIDQFLHSHEIEANYLVKKMIAGGMVNQILNFSTEGTETSREEFEELILKWLNFKYSKQLKKETNLSLNFYLTNKVEFSKSIHRISADKNLPEEFFSDEIEEIKSMIEEISSIRVSTFREKEEEVDENHPIKSITEFKIPSLDPRLGLFYDNIDLILSDYEKNKIKENAKHFDIDIPDVIFDFGDLKETKSFNVAFLPKYSLNGTEQEKEKKELFDKLEQKLSKLADFKIFWKEFTELSVLPIILANDGNELKENIRVRLFFPKETEVIFPHNFPTPNRISNLQIINDPDSFFVHFLKHQKDSNVLEYYSNILHTMPFLPLNPFFSTERHGFESDKYKRMLENCFEYEIFRDREKEVILECEIEELNTSDKIGLPSYIFIKEKSDFTVNYEILCKNEPNEITGELRYIASS